MNGRSRFGLWQIAFGTLAIIFGLWTLLRPEDTLGKFVFALGLFIILSGISDIVFYCKMKQYTLLRPVVMLVVGILNILLGGFMVVHNGFGIWTLNTLFPLWFFFHCVGRLSNMDYIQPFLEKWQYWLVMAICLAGFMLGIAMMLYPGASVRTSAAFIGIYLVLLGADALVLGFGDTGASRKDAL